jgi:hypothetical protein
MDAKEYFEQIHSKKGLDEILFFSSVVLAKDLWVEITKTIEGKDINKIGQTADKNITEPKILLH